MRRASTIGRPGTADDARPLSAVEVEGEGRTHRFRRDFVFGREPTCEVCVEGRSRVSRRHAEVRVEDGRWWVADLGSANGTFLDGERIERAPLPREAAIQLGPDGPAFRLRLDAPPEVLRTSGPAGEEAGPPASAAESSVPARPAGPAPGRPEAEPPTAEEGADEDLSLSRVARHYFGGAPDAEAGERTRFIRRAYAQVQEKQRRQYGVLVGAALLVGLVAVAFAGWQVYRTQELRDAAAEVFNQMREQDLAIATQIAASGEITPEELAELSARRQRSAQAYEGFVEELGVYRSLTEEEELIYKVARIFNESEFTMPAGFVREVKTYIRAWQSSDRFERAVRHAEAMGYTPIVVGTMRRYGLPPEFFYLGLQESNFNTQIVGPQTRWGIAKGAWQFIPSTGQRYGLRIGPRADVRAYDPQDERHQFARATDAAARYLLDIYTQLAQASGLLVCASYNWGEHRVAPRLDDLPPPGIERARAAMAGIPMNPQERSYWRFYSAYADRMPDETKGYVMHIFAAAVIGQNPRFFGIDMDNPLAKYLEAPLTELDLAPPPAEADPMLSPTPDSALAAPIPGAAPTPLPTESSGRLGLDALQQRR